MSHSTRLFLLVAAALFFLLLSVSLNIDYVQNDEYIHYQTVNNFLGGNFTLPAYLASTFYTQGILSALFSSLFGLGNLPILTALLSSLTIFVFMLLLNRIMTLSPLQTILTGLLLFLNPIYLYSSLGFMTEIYFLFFFMLSLYYFYTYQKLPDSKNLVFFFLFSILSFFVRQIGLCTLLAASFFFFRKRSFKLGFTSLATAIALGVFYMALFPKTTQMSASFLAAETILNPERLFSYIGITAIYLSVFITPLVPTFVLSTTKKSRILLFIIITITLGLAIKLFFQPQSIKHTTVNQNYELDIKFSAEYFPYLGNTFGRKGFFQENLAGEKYSYEVSDKLFYLLEVLGKIMAVSLIALAVMNWRKLLNFECLYLMFTVAFFIVSPRVYDRYLISLITVAIILVVKVSKPATYLLIPFLILLAFLDYQYTSDFFAVNKYVKQRTDELLKSENISEKDIKADNSWNVTHPNKTGKWKYYFEYKGTEKQKVDDGNFTLVEKHKITFPFSFYSDSYVYLYKRT
ncbi:hypothetical protein A3K34_03730 [candidate division WWE3 bacterium RIFOXYC1_FULL_40_10]|nr:MAG: hypothetical protein A3K58_03730 [candidate division WWE3 bacterium RIFOXYB1_FULL_40_22]OGC61952.1 MAG: hypothetical protein A3K37_03730 [candidate division WWE3 bacterium RIFOXYA1_FULL_40_11]OGC66335.1 MAG: hypothetical protein A3K34_03730 [candidate division WWE3 bacterium RIFOXYC1_FULL_40_10]OGC67937.1 MAG: hypothetical protein A2450_01925 [candidate division WWE3 bacterium RIFOXYC2_FULL_40_11]OGC70697.1 MAG: hypothetical protein A2602_00150 [candidate division WWE3 bacterium RIFOXYD